jgi:hypothetical protein
MATMEGFVDPKVKAAERQEQISEMRRTIITGMDFDSWLHGPMGKALKAMADLEIEFFRNDLEDVDADDVKLVKAIQMEIAKRRLVFKWIDEVVQEGLEMQRLAHEQGHVD